MTMLETIPESLQKLTKVFSWSLGFSDVEVFLGLYASTEFIGIMLLRGEYDQTGTSDERELLRIWAGLRYSKPIKTFYSDLSYPRYMIFKDGSVCTENDYNYYNKVKVFSTVKDCVDNILEIPEWKRDIPDKVFLTHVEETN